MTDTRRFKLIKLDNLDKDENHSLVEIIQYVIDQNEEIKTGSKALEFIIRNYKNILKENYNLTQKVIRLEEQNETLLKNTGVMINGMAKQLDVVREFKNLLDVIR